MDVEALAKSLAGEPGYRIRQAKQAVFRDFVEDWSLVTTLPKALRHRLEAECPLLIPAEIRHSKDGRTSKALVGLYDGTAVEAVLMRHPGLRARNTVCLSSQVGCAMGCAFCATGDMGFVRDLSASEIVAQVLVLARLLARSKEKVTNIVLMGMGEPFNNYDNVMAAIRLLNDEETMGLGARRFSISTVGITEGIDRLADEGLEVNLAVSLHTADQELRQRLVPSAKRYPVSKIMEAIHGYLRKTNRKVMIEYAVIDGVNDGPEQALGLAALLRGTLCVVNLISYNKTSRFSPASTGAIRRFRQVLESEGINVVQRFRYGEGIRGACGQLAAGSRPKSVLGKNSTVG